MQVELRLLPLVPVLVPVLVVLGATGSSGAVGGQWQVIAMDTPQRTYLDLVPVLDGRAWAPEQDGWPTLAQWENVTQHTAIRTLPFSPDGCAGPSAEQITVRARSHTAVHCSALLSVSLALSPLIHTRQSRVAGAVAAAYARAQHLRGRPPMQR